MNKQADLLNIHHPINSDLFILRLHFIKLPRKKKKKKQMEPIILMSLIEISLRPIFYKTWWLAKNKWVLVIIF